MADQVFSYEIDSWLTTLSFKHVLAWYQQRSDFFYFDRILTNIKNQSDIWSDFCILIDFQLSLGVQCKVEPVKEHFEVQEEKKES